MSMLEHAKVLSLGVILQTSSNPLLLPPVVSVKLYEKVWVRLLKVIEVTIFSITSMDVKGSAIKSKVNIRVADIILEPIVCKLYAP